MSEIKFEIKEDFGILSKNDKGWKKDVNLIFWNGAVPKYDICDRAPNYEKMGRRLLGQEEADALY